MTRRKRSGYFAPRQKDSPRPLTASITRRVAFGEVDAMAVAWHGHYAAFFEAVSTELRRKCGLTYSTFRDAGICAPVVQLHVDYHSSVLLDEQITIQAAMIWTDAARLDTEYTVLKEDGRIAATGYTVQMFADATSGEPCITWPPLLLQCRRRWQESVS